MADRIHDDTAESVLERFGFSLPPATDLAGLRELYRAWGRAVPFDNVRKRIALESGDPSPLPGGHAEDFLGAWLRHGTGGTCWPSSNGLYALLAWCGFEARRLSASMRDGGDPNHGTVVVSVDGEDWLADTALLADDVLPLRPGQESALDDPLHRVRVEPRGDSFLIRWALPAQHTPEFTCGLLEDPVDHDYYLERYELTRAPDGSPFNAFLYATRNQADSVLAYMGRTRFRKRRDAIEEEELKPEEIARSLVSELGLSEEIVAELQRRGGI